MVIAPRASGAQIFIGVPMGMAVSLRKHQGVSHVLALGAYAIWILIVAKWSGMPGVVTFATTIAVDACLALKHAEIRSADLMDADGSVAHALKGRYVRMDIVLM